MCLFCVWMFLSLAGVLMNFLTAQMLSMALMLTKSEECNWKMVTFRGILSLKTTIVTRNSNTAICKQRHFQRLTGHETEQSSLGWGVCIKKQTKKHTFAWNVHRESLNALSPMIVNLIESIPSDQKTIKYPCKRNCTLLNTDKFLILATDNSLCDSALTVFWCSLHMYEWILSEFTVWQSEFEQNYTIIFSLVSLYYKCLYL